MAGRPFRAALAGLGTVGSSFVQLLHLQREYFLIRALGDIQIFAYCARTGGLRGLPLQEARFYADAVDMAQQADVDVFIELMGGAGDPAYAAVKAALSRGIPVISANKAMLALHGRELAHLGEQTGATLRYEAAVGGGVPIIKTLRESLAGNRITRLSGILNGTCNYILSRMETEHAPFVLCLQEAQRLGYAEADPSFDIGGFDTAYKLAILASLAFGVPVDSEAVSVEGIETITLADLAAANDLGFRIKLLGVVECTDHGLEQRVHPTMVAKSTPLAQTMGVLNAVTIEADALGALTLIGPGAGGMATASAVLMDLIDLVSDRKAPTFGRPVSKLVTGTRASQDCREGSFYIRLNALDRPSSIAMIARHMAERGVFLESIVQKRGEEDPSDYVSLVMVTRKASENHVRNALAAIVAEGIVCANTQLIRIQTS